MNGEQPITVSRDALRADLLEMELRLRTFFDKQLAAKADKADLAALTLRQSATDRGDMTPSQLARIKDIIREERLQAGTESWSNKERWLATLSALVTAGMLLLSVAVAINGGAL